MTSNNVCRRHALRIAVGILVLALLLVGSASALSIGGRIVVNADDWTTTDGNFDNSAKNFTLNVFDWLTKSKPNATILVDAQFNKTHPELQYDLMINELIANGYTVEIANTDTWTSAYLSGFDAVLIESGDVNSTVLTAYVNAGGGVYVVGGTWEAYYYYNNFLSNFDMGLLLPQVSIGAINITDFEDHPITQGVMQLRTAGPTPIFLTSDRPKILKTAYEINWLAVFDQQVAIPDTVHNINKGTNYTTIQAAINDANPGDEIRVDSGTYFENVNVSKQLILKGVDTGGGKPVVDAKGNGSAITLAVDGIILEGFTATGGGWNYEGNGIKVTSNRNTLNGNNASNNDYGISLYSSNNNTLSGNSASNNYKGIFLYNSSNYNTLSSNNASSNYHEGIALYYYSNYNTLSGNNATSNEGFGIIIDNSGNNTISRNNVSNSNDGIYLESSSDNTLVGNNISNSNDGIFLAFSINNMIYNNIFNNTNNFYFFSLIQTSIWNTTLQSSPNIIGGPYIGGNLWVNPNGTGFSQICTDSNKDGICDSPYTLDSSNIDYLPLAYKPNISDAIPPVINNVTLNTTAPFTDQAILVTVNTTDNVGVTSVKAITVGNFAVETSLTSQGGNIWNGTITAIEGNHSVNISAHDAAGNVAWDNSTSYTAIAGPIPPVPELNTAILVLTGIFGILFVSRKYKRT